MTNLPKTNGGWLRICLPRGENFGDQMLGEKSWEGIAAFYDKRKLYRTAGSN